MEDFAVYSEKFWKKNWDQGIDDLAPEDYETTYVEMIEKIFREFPDKTALGYMGVDISFRELDSHANRFANMLIDKGFQKGDVAAINLPNIPEYPISLIGALRAGCVTSGLSPLLSADQIKYQLNDLGSSGKRVALVTLDAIFAGHIVKIASDIPSLKLVVATNVAAFLPKWKQAMGKLLKKVPSGKVRPIGGKTTLLYHKDVLESYPDSPVNVDVSPDDLSCIQYTGGTTGPPKGAMLTHRNTVHNIMSVTRWLGWGMDDGTLLSGFPMFHVAGLLTCECAIYYGWTQILIPNPRDTDYICKEMKKRRPTNLANVPSLYQMLMENEKFRALDHSALGACISGAAPFPAESQKKLEAIIGEGKILEVYGMTETSPISAMNPSKGKKKPGTVGMPFLNAECKLISAETGEEAKPGEPGEICVKGPMVMKGYFNKPEETEHAIDKDGYMRTGDVGIMDEDGYIRIVDRVKDMIIVGGFKVFSSKVEDMLARHPAVGVIALIGVENPDRPGSELVKAFIQRDPSYSGSEADIKEGIIKYAKEKCAPYEVPKLIEIIEEAPLTVVGKIDKKALRALEKERC